MMRQFIVALLVFLSGTVAGQTTLTSGDWTDPTVWSTGVIPTTTSTVVVSHPLDILSNLSPGNGGNYTFNANATDQPGGTAYAFTPNHDNAEIVISSGATVTFTAGSTWQSGTVEIYGTLIVGAISLTNDSELQIYIRPGGTLIINGNLTNNNNSGILDVAGALIINGNYNGATGSTEVTGAGTISATGTISSSGGSTVFGTGNDCTAGPCSGTSLNCTHANGFTPGSATLCSGGTVTFTGNATGTTPTYLWESSTDNTNWVTAAGTSNTANYTTAALTVTTWFRLQKTVSGCTSTSGVVQVTVLAGGGWKGVTNDWGTASNWCSGSVPNSSTDVVITNSTGMAFMPVVNAGTAAVCNNLTISNTSPVSSVTIAAAADASLSISADFTNNGTFTDNSTAAAAGLKFVGTAQTLAGNAIAVNNLTIANTSLSATNANITVNSNLTLTSGIVDMNTFTLKLGTSTSSTGALAYTAGHIYNGNFQRWYSTAAVALGNASLFPVGSSLYYRNMYLVSSGLTTSGGSIKVSHTYVADASTVSFTDGGTVTRRSNSFWTVTPNGLSSTGTPFNMRTDAEGIGTVGDLSHLRITLAAAAAPGTHGTTGGTTTTPQVNRTGLSVANLTNNFYWGSTDATITPLPVVLRWFDGTFTNNEVELSWKTESERNCDYFSVWHSADGEQFEEIGQVAGLGTSSVGKTYSMAHARPARGINYYQLRQVDFDQTETAFQVIRVEADPAAQFLTIYPNPVETAGTLNIDLQLPASSGAVDISIVDMSGKALLQFTGLPNDEGILTYSFDTSELAPGMYVVRAGSAKKRVFVK
jgi:hypothetical protein